MAHEMGDTPATEKSMEPVSLQLAGGRICTIRLSVETDAAALCAFMPKTHGESDFLNYLPGEWDLSVEEEVKFIRDRKESDRSVLIVAEVDGCIVATAGVESMKFRRFAHHAELGMTVAKEYWGQGIGRKLMECIIDWARQRKLRKLYLRVFESNHRANALYGSQGFVEEARLKGDFLRRDGTYGDTIVMAKFFPVWS